MTDLTPEKIDEMGAGREMDALVAERVMGWETIRVGYYGMHTGNEWDETPRQKELEDWLDKMCINNIGDYAINVDNDVCKTISGEGYQYPEDWLPSTDISAAWEVVEKITEIPRTIENAKRKPNTIFAMLFQELNLWSMTASEVAEAICRAALKAVIGKD